MDKYTGWRGLAVRALGLGRVFLCKRGAGALSKGPGKAPPAGRRKMQHFGVSPRQLFLMDHDIRLAAVALERAIEEQVAHMAREQAGKAAGSAGGRVRVLDLSPAALSRLQGEVPAASRQAAKHTHTQTPSASPLDLVRVAAVLVARLHQLAPHRVELVVMGFQQGAVPLPQALALQGQVQWRAVHVAVPACSACLQCLLALSSMRFVLRVPSRPSCNRHRSNCRLACSLRLSSMSATASASSLEKLAQVPAASPPGASAGGVQAAKVLHLGRQQQE